MSRKRLVGKRVLIDKLKPELGAEIMERIVGQQEPSSPPPKPRRDAAGRTERRARTKNER
jgi:hypothetical protein